LFFVFAFVFQFQKSHMVTSVSHRKKLNLSNLIVPVPEDRNEWFWTPVKTSVLAHLLKTGYDNITHRLICALSER